VDGTEILLKLV